MRKFTDKRDFDSQVNIAKGEEVFEKEKKGGRGIGKGMHIIKTASFI